MDGEVAIILVLLLFIACFSTALPSGLVYVESKKMTDGSERVEKPVWEGYNKAQETHWI